MGKKAGMFGFAIVLLIVFFQLLVMMGEAARRKPLPDFVNESVQDELAHFDGGIEEVLAAAEKISHGSNSLKMRPFAGQDIIEVKAWYSPRESDGGVSRLLFAQDDKAIEYLHKNLNPENIHAWNDRLVVWSDTKNVFSQKHYSLIRFLKPFFLLYSLALLASLLTLKVMGKAMGDDRVFPILLLLLMAGDAYFTAVSEIGKTVQTHSRPGMFSAQDGAAIKVEANRLLRDERLTSFRYATPACLKDYAFSGVFIAKGPLFPVEYVRLNIDLCTYLFVSDEIKDPKTFNKDMDYERICDGVWLGRYSAWIGNIESLNHSSRVGQAAVWILFAVFVFFWIRLFMASIRRQEV